MTPEYGEGAPVILDQVKRGTFRIRYRNERGKCLTGTAFAIDKGSLQYLVTAHHVVDGIPDRGGLVDVFVDGAWRKDNSLSLVGIGPAFYKQALQVDVAVLKLKLPLPVSPAVTTSPAAPTPGQPVYMLGFPSRESDLSDEETQRPPALIVEPGTFMGFDFEGSRMLIEGTATKGMSGGPVVFVPEDQESNELRIVGVLTELLCPVPTPPVVGAYGIRHAITAIDRNPGGALPSAECRVVLT